MPLNCCVPNCKSKYKKGGGISFHELPANMSVREKWIKIISRKISTPDELENYRVCSKHFVDQDFNQSVTRKILSRTAVPSVFPGYPSYMQPKPKKQRSSLAVEKRSKAQMISISKPCAKIFVVPTVEECDNTQQQEGPLSTDKNTQQQEEPLSIDKNTQQQEEPLSTDKNPQIEDKATQVDVFRREKNQQLNAVKQQARKNMFRLQELQYKHNLTKIQLKNLQKNPQIKAMQRVMEKANAGDSGAILLMDLVTNFGSKTPKFQSDTIEQCSMWREHTRVGYEYARQNLSWKLPSRSTLSRYTGEIKEYRETLENESEIDEDIETLENESEINDESDALRIEWEISEDSEPPLYT